MVLETNTFGASSIVLAEYGLEGQVAAINHQAVQHARAAISGQEVYVLGSIGPTTKLPTLGHITVDCLSIEASPLHIGHQPVHARLGAPEDQRLTNLVRLSQ